MAHSNHGGIVSKFEEGDLIRTQDDDRDYVILCAFTTIDDTTSYWVARQDNSGIPFTIVDQYATGWQKSPTFFEEGETYVLKDPSPYTRKNFYEIHSVVEINGTRWAFSTLCATGYAQRPVILNEGDYSGMTLKK